MKDTPFVFGIICVLLFVMLLFMGNTVRKQRIELNEVGLHAIALQKRIELLESTINEVMTNQVEHLSQTLEMGRNIRSVYDLSKGCRCGVSVDPGFNIK